MAALKDPKPATQKTVGVLGGMGPQATVDFMNMVIALTPADRDQDHLRLLIDSNPHVPDRQAAMHGDDTAVRSVLRDMALGLERQGADFLVMPCNTAHAFIDDAVAAVRIPFVSIIDITVAAVLDAVPGARRVGLLATDACIESGSYQTAARASALDVVLPDARGQAECMALIAAVKAGDTGADPRAGMARLAAALVDKGVEALIAGCTEIPLILEDDDVAVALISSTDVLAARAVDYALGRLPLPHTELT
jgi:aspartate racemase